MSQIKRYEPAHGTTNSVCATGKYVLHTDHLASHAFDEEKERAAFKAAWSSGAFPLAFVEDYALCLCVWLAAAKSRAKAAGCE